VLRDRFCKKRNRKKKSYIPEKREAINNLKGKKWNPKLDQNN
jgi:hypothetical protein